MTPKKIQVILLALIVFVVGYQTGIHKVALDWKNYKPKISVTGAEPPVNITRVDFGRFWTVWQKIEEDYYDKTKINPQKMLDGAITGMIGSLGDPYTIYLPPQKNTDFKNGLAGQFQGIGAELGLTGNQIVVVAPLDGSPAKRGGIKPEDAILKVDGEATSGWSLAQAVEKIRGPKGTKVTLNILHKGKTDPEDIEITRDLITIKSVTGWVKKIKDVPNIKLEGSLSNNKENSVTYIRLSQFGDSTNKDWVELVNNLSQKTKQDSTAKGVILDLRNNPGGYLTDAVFIAAEFLNEGSPVVIQDTGTGEKTTLSVTRHGLYLDTPVVIIINKGSASASEIVSGALRDHKRATLVGDTSFGKGTVQQAEDLGDGAGIHVTIAKWLTPNETWINGKGLEPDVKVSLPTKEQERDTQLEKAIEELVK